jgi:hypothetical protein
MSKFEVGDLVRVVWCRQCEERNCQHIKIFGGNPTEINYVFESSEGMYNLEGDSECNWYDSELELSQENNEGSVKMSGRRTFKLVVNLPNVKKGALFQEKCDDGDQDYVLLDNSYQKYDYQGEGGLEAQPRGAVEKESKFFVEVFSATNEYLTEDELKAWKAFKAGKTVVSKSPSKPSTSNGESARRAKISIGAKKAWRRRRAAQRG